MIINKELNYLIKGYYNLCCSQIFSLNLRDKAKRRKYNARYKTDYIDETSDSWRSTCFWIERMRDEKIRRSKRIVYFLSHGETVLKEKKQKLCCCGFLFTGNSLTEKPTKNLHINNHVLGISLVKIIWNCFPWIEFEFFQNIFW